MIDVKRHRGGAKAFFNHEPMIGDKLEVDERRRQIKNGGRGATRPTLGGSYLLTTKYSNYANGANPEGKAGKRGVDDPPSPRLWRDKSTRANGHVLHAGTAGLFESAVAAALCRRSP
jgi:hypothetical protein